MERVQEGGDTQYKQGRLTPEMFESFQVVQEVGAWRVRSWEGGEGGKAGGHGELCMSCAWKETRLSP